MECFNPIYLPRQDQTVACGKCIPCLHNMRRDWSTRMWFERKASKNAYFITLTYSPENVPRDPDSGYMTLSKKHVRKFLQDIKVHYKKTVRQGKKFISVYNTPRWFVIGEYGPSTERPHYHAIVFLQDHPDFVQVVKKFWPKGFITIKPVTNARIEYCAKYQFSKFDQDITINRQDPFRIVTKSSGGIGKQWLNDENKAYAIAHLDGRLRVNNRFAPIPKYYRERIGYTTVQKSEMFENMEMEYISRRKSRVQDLIRDGVQDPERELRYEYENRIGRIKKRITKGQKI